MVASAGPVPIFIPVRETPLSVRTAEFVVRAVWVLLSSPLPRLVWEVAVSVVVALVVTHPARSGHSFFAAALTVALFVVLFWAVGSMGYKLSTSTWYARVAHGRPRFGPLDGPGRRWFRFVLRSHANLTLTFDRAENAVVSVLGELDEAATEHALRQKYVALNGSDRGWRKCWRDIQRAEHGDVTYGESLRSSAWSMMTFATVGFTVLVGGPVVLYLGGAVWLLNGVVDGDSSLRLLQLTVLTGFAIAALAFVKFTVQLRDLSVVTEEQAHEVASMLRHTGSDAGMAEQPDKDRIAELREVVRPHQGRKLHPKVEIGDGYVLALRDYFGWQLFVGTLVNAGLVMTLLLAQWPLTLLVSGWSDAQVTTWTTRMLLGTAALPFALTAALYVAFTTLAWFTARASIVVAAVLSAVIPPIGQYVLGEAITERTVVGSALAAVISIVPTTIAEIIKQPVRTQVSRPARRARRTAVTVRRRPARRTEPAE